MCSRKLVPVFQVLCAMFVAVAAEFAASELMGYGNSLEGLKFLFLFSGLIVGWFAGKMLVERSARVFRPQNWVGLGILAAVLAVSMGLTKLDVLGLEERMPDIGDIASVQLNFYKMDDRADIETLLRLHNLALNDRVKEDGAYALVEDNGEYVRMEDSSYRYWQEGDPLPQQRIATSCYLTYTLKNGKTVQRSYNVWVDSAAGEIPRKLLSRWDAVNSDTVEINGKDVEVLPLVLDSMERMYCSMSNGKLPEELKTRAAAESLIRAIKADCAAGTMAQSDAYHDGVFVIPRTDDDPYETRDIYITLSSKNYSWSVNVFADCENTIRWMRDNGLLSENVTIQPHGSSPRYY